MKLRWTTRTSLFARMSLLFGLLVTVPLIISGIVLSLVGSQSVIDSGKAVAGIGREAAQRQATQMKVVAKKTLDEGAQIQASVTEKIVGKSLEKAVEAGKQAFDQNADRMSQSGAKAVAKSTQKVVNSGQEALNKALKSLQEVPRDSLTDVSRNFSEGMRKGLAESSPLIQTDIQTTLLRMWEVTAERRIGSIQDFDTGEQNRTVVRLQYPLRVPAIVYPEPTEAPRYLELVRKNAKLQVVRVVLVSDQGTEMARVPETDLRPNEDGEDWSDPTVSPVAAATREAFRKSPEPYVVEPIRYDERSKHWIRRIVHGVIKSSDSSSDVVAPKPDAGEVPAMPKGKPDNPFVVVDIALESLVEVAASDTLPSGMVLMMIKGTTGEVISSFPKPEKDIGPRLLARLAKLEGAKSFTKTSSPIFDYPSADGRRMLARVRYWPEPNNVWIVVAQPEGDILEPAQQLATTVNSSWEKALKDVQASGEEYTRKRNAKAQKKQKELLDVVTVQMEKEETQQSNAVKREFASDKEGLVLKFGKQLAGQVEELQKKSRDQSLKELLPRKRDAILAVSKAVRDQTDQAVTDITQQSTIKATRSGKDMLLNSAWLIPLFLVLALFLATMTAKSLVRPINQLVKGTQALTAGEYHQRIKVQGDDELARLALAFNEMAGAIQRGQADLLQSHDTLAGEKTRMQGIVDSSPDGLVMLEPNGQIAFINPAAIRLLDISQDYLPEAPFEIAQLPESPSARLQQCLDVGQSGEGVQEFEFAEPHRRVLQVRCVRLRSGQGRSYGQLLHLHDITRERVIDEMKSDFISLVSHELRTPLTSILGFSSYMLTGKLGQVAETQRTALESIHRQAKRLSAIISDFLDISRIESGKIEMKKDPVPVAQVAGRVVEDLRPQANEKSIRVVARAVDETFPLVALGDDQRIAQIFTNLIGNALKFTEKDGQIDVLLSRSNGELVCQVKDSGCGIPPDELARVFDRFYQVEKVVTRKTGGTGLGLAIVKNIIEAHGGRVWIESEVGKGTTVSFTLPGAD